MPPSTTERTDLLVIGGGIAGRHVVLRPGREAALEVWR